MLAHRGASAHAGKRHVQFAGTVHQVQPASRTPGSEATCATRNTRPESGSAHCLQPLRRAGAPACVSTCRRLTFSGGGSGPPRAIGSGAVRCARHSAGASTSVPPPPPPPPPSLPESPAGSAPSGPPPASAAANCCARARARSPAFALVQLSALALRGSAYLTEALGLLPSAQRRVTGSVHLCLCHY